MGDSPYGRILIPVDGTEDALRVIRPAGELARVMEASVDFLYVSPFDESTDEGDASWLPASIVRPAAEEAQEILPSRSPCFRRRSPAHVIIVREYRRRRFCALST